MAKVSAVERNLKRQRMVAKYAGKRALLKDIARNIFEKRTLAGILCHHTLTLQIAFNCTYFSHLFLLFAYCKYICRGLSLLRKF